MPTRVVVRKVKGGKLFRLVYDPTSQRARVSLDGDFFLHPEDSLELLQHHLEECLRMAEEASAASYLEGKLEEDGIRIIGMSAADLISALWEARR